MTTPSNEKQQAPGRKFPNDLVAAVKDIRWPYAFVALCLAVTLWYTVTVRDKVESWVDVQVVFKGAPENLVISDGLINKLSVRVRAARGLSRGLTGRDASVVVDLSSITKGSNAIIINRELLPFNSAYEVMEVSPSRILIVADTTTTREMTLESYFDGKLAPDLFVKSIRITPQKVTVSGADSIVSGVSRIRIPVPLTADMPGGTSAITVAVPVSTSIAVTPPQVSVEIEVGVRKRQMKLTRTITPTAYTDGRKPVFSPDKVTIFADVPESIAKDEKKMASITAGVALPPDLGKEARKLAVSVSLPDNATLISVNPVEVTVSLPAMR